MVASSSLGGTTSSGAGLGTSLSTFSGTTDPIDDGSGVLLNLNASPVMLIARVSADKPCKIRAYNSADARTADTPRSPNIPPTDTIEGLVFEVELTEDNLEYDLSFNVPYINLDDPQQSDIYINAFNLSGSNSTLFISVDAVVAGGGGGSSVGNTKGDLTGHDGSKPIRIPIGSPGQVLTVDLDFPGGLKWANFKGGGSIDELKLYGFQKLSDAPVLKPLIGEYEQIGIVLNQALVLFRLDLDYNVIDTQPLNDVTPP